MAEKIVGKIQYINEKDGNYGKSYNLKVDGETYYLQGKFPPRGIEQGDTVEVEWEYKGNYKVANKGGVRKIEGAATAQPPAQQAATKQAFTKANSFDDRQDVISKQAALNTSLEFLRFAKENDTLPALTKKNEGFGYLKALWLKEAAFLYELNTGKVWELPDTNVEDEAPKPVKKAALKKAPPTVEEHDEDVAEVEDEEDNWN